MKIQIESKVLMDTLKRVQSVVEKRNTIPILSNVLVEIKDGNDIRLTATDLDIEITETVAALSIEGQDGFTVPARTLYDIIRKLPKGCEVALEIIPDDYSGRLKIEAGRSKFELPLLPTGDFPKMTNSGDAHSFTMTVGQIRRLIDKTRFAISTEETRYYLNGIYFHHDGGQLTCVATDGHRLAKASTPLPDGADGMGGIIVPRKTVAEIRRLLDSSPETDSVALSVTDAKIQIEHHSAVLVSKLIDGTFPDYNRVVPGKTNSRLTIDGKVFSGAIDRVSTVTQEKTRTMKMILEADSVRLEVNSPETGHAHEDVNSSYGGDDLQIGFNSKYMIEALSLVEAPEAEMHFSSPAAPVLLLDPNDEDCLFVIMPLRI